MTGFNAWPDGVVNVANGAFNGGSFDGRYLWCTPYNANCILRLDTKDGSMTGYFNWPLGSLSIGQAAFLGGSFDGRYVWAVPLNADRVVRVDTTCNSSSLASLVGFDNWPTGIQNIQNEAFAGSVFDGVDLWLVPYNADRVVRLRVS